MLSSPQTVAPKPASLPPAMPSPQPGSGSAGNGPTFTQFLNDQAAMPPAHTDAAPREPESPSETKAASAPPPNVAARRPQAPSPQPKSTNPTQKNTAEAGPSAPAQPAKDVDASEDSGDTTAAKTDKDDPETSGLDEFTQLIGLTAPAQPAVPMAAEAAATGAHPTRANHGLAAEDESTAKRTVGAADAGMGAQLAEHRTSEAPTRGAEAQPRGKADAAAAVAAAADKLASHGTGTTETLQAAPAQTAGTPHALAGADAGTPNFAAVLAQAMPTGVVATDVASPAAQAQVHTAVHSSAFGAELGARVSLLAVDGQQSAELQLNPADMGPVAVQIVVDGSQAQVSFHAAHAETRAALEKSLPDLAAALQGQGLTLSGGGVFQQAPRDSSESSDREEGTGRSARAGSISRIGAAGTSTAATPARRTVGLLDTFA